MTATPSPSTPPKAPQSSDRVVSTGSSRARRDQLISLAVVIACGIGILAMHPVLLRERNAMVKDRVDSIRQLSIEFPRLVLGGFRGILAPILWQRAEDNKNERKWMELDSTYNIIGKLQPYFVTVYIFNAWNQAYNLSAQWHNIDEKYKWVLDGLGHLYEGEEFNPGNRDIEVEQAQMYFLKLGNSFERISYRRFWRQDIEHQYWLDPKLQPTAAAGAASLDTHRKVRSYILKPEFNSKLATDPNQPDKIGYGLEITGLIPGKPLEPVQFRYGLSPFYFAYKEYQRCVAGGLGPTTMGRQVAAAFPYMSLRMWVRDDVYYSQTLMREMFQYTPKSGEADGFIPDFDRNVLAARECFRNIKLIGPQAAAGFDRYKEEYPDTYRTTHRKHQLEVQWTQAIGEAEEQLFEGLVAWQLNGRKLGGSTVYAPQILSRMTTAMEKYAKAIDMVQNYLDTIYPDKENPDRADFGKYQTACRMRVEGIKALLTLPAGGKPNFDFLTPESVER